jgi:hypothetical protein
VTAWQRDLDEAIAEQVGRLKSEPVKRLLNTSDIDLVKQFVQVLDTGKTEALIVLLTDALVQHIQALFSDANIVSAASDVLLQIRESYSTIERQQLKEFVQAIELLLEAKFEEVEAANPGKTVRVNLE